MTNDEVKEEFAKNLSGVATKGVDYLELFKKTGITYQDVSNYLHGRHMISLCRAIKLAQYFDVSLDELVGLKGTSFATISDTVGVPKRVMQTFSSLPYAKKKLVIDMIDVLSKKE